MPTIAPIARQVIGGDSQSQFVQPRVSLTRPSGLDKLFEKPVQHFLIYHSHVENVDRLVANEVVYDNTHC